MGFPDIWGGVKSAGRQAVKLGGKTAGVFGAGIQAVDYGGGKIADLASATGRYQDAADDSILRNIQQDAALRRIQQAKLGGTGGYAADDSTVTGGTGGYSGGGGGGAPAVRAGEVANLKNEIIARRDRANAIFDALTGAVSALAAAKRQEFETQFGEEQQKATDEFGEQSKTLSRTYRGRGLGDSSYRINALEGAGKAFQGALTQLGRQRATGLGEIGATAAGQLASLSADRGSLADLRLDEYGDDVGKLRELRNSIDERIRNAEVSGAQLQTPQGFAGRLNQIAPYGGTTNALKGALDSLIKSATPRAVKDTLVQAVIGNYDPDNAAFWQDYYEKEARKTETRV